MKVSFSLANVKAKAKPAGEAPALKKPIAFASLEDDEPIDAAPTAGSSGRANINKQVVAQSVEMSKAMKKKLEEEKKVDATVFEYDEVYDKMKAIKEQQKITKEADARERKVHVVRRCREYVRLTALAAEIYRWPSSSSCNQEIGSSSSRRKAHTT